MTSAQPVRLASALKARERALGGDPVADPDAQVQALLDAVAALDAASVDSALIGGIAVGVRTAMPRATLAVDLAAPSTTPRQRIVTALVAADFAHRGSFAHSENFRHPNGEPVHVALDPGFDAFSTRAEETQVGSRWSASSRPRTCSP